MLAELFLALQLLDGVKQRDGIAPSSTPEQTDQEKFVEGAKDFIAGLEDAFDKFNPFKRF
jgi:hypothetical protein